jgi:hypothetical protein
MAEWKMRESCSGVLTRSRARFDRARARGGSSLCRRYAAEVALDGKVYRAATNVGVRPTFDGARTTVESHLLDFNESRISGPVEVRFLTRLRDEKKFSGPQALREQVLKDIERAREYFHAIQAGKS